jgi:uncharacterized membrane protein YjjP (DUF1212 family)
MEPIPAAPDRRRAIRVALRLGVVMLASGAQTREVETSLRLLLEALGHCCVRRKRGAVRLPA